MDLAANGWEVTVAGKVVRLDDLPLAAWERITEVTEVQWVDAYYKPLADLSVARMLVAECCKTINEDPTPILETITVPKILAMFNQAEDDLPIEVTDGVPQPGVDSLTDGSPS
tara:strand:+ start:379 stop:717 length:339 start_codon:yes stop_codon:yes gene_type:complete